MTKLPIDLPIKTMTSKVSAEAHERMKLIAKSHGFLMQDVLSACLLHMPENDIIRILEEQAAIVDKLPKSIKALLKNVDKLSANERDMLRDVLAQSE